MSSSSSAVTQKHFAYIAAHTRPEDEFARRLKSAATAEGLPEIWIAAEQANFLQVLLRVAKARHVIEVGTLGGYSALAMARALPVDGKLITIELDAKHAAFARHWLGQSDVAERVEVREGDGQAVLRTLAASSADAFFIDADKEGYPAYVDEAARILRPGGLLLVDNALAFGQLLDERPTDSSVPAVRRFNDLMAARRDFHGVIAPIGDGCWVAVKEAQ